MQNARSIVTLALLCPASLQAQSLFHAPLPPAQPPAQQQQQPPQQQQQTQPPQAQQQPAPADATQPTTQQQPAQQQQQQAQAQAAAAPQRPLPSAPQISLFAVKPASQRQFNKQDKIEIIVNESSLQKFDQKTDSKESADIDASLKALPNLNTLLTDLALRNTGAVTPKIGFGNGSTYKGQGAYERKDKFTARISAIVTDVKPNGMLVLEARETILSDKESQSLVVSGLCDPKDITTANTVTSSQLANLVIKTEHGGDVKDAATKGWLPRFFDTITGN